MKNTTDWRGATLSAVRQYRAEHGWPPTLDDVARIVGMPTRSAGIGYRLHSLARDGLIQQEPGIRRTIRLTDAGWVRAIDWELRQQPTAQAVMSL